ncbi:secretion system protein E [bacterium (Candidatus Howlettbacteria) CG_4_10_14_0_8_um_filter_40_9]|nr:MAG: secretion system protein E [bacterium (Candidatus Howlettbacteria) CG_4_10_14_0_8_um_filter_40_9]
MKIKNDVLKEILVAYKTLPEEKIDTAVSASKQSGTPLLQVLINKKYLTEKEIYEVFAKYLKIPFVDLDDVQAPKELLAKLPEKVAQKYKAVVYGEDNGHLMIAMEDPSDFQSVQFIEKILDYKIQIHLASPKGISTVLEQYKGGLSTEITKAMKSDEEEEGKEELKGEELQEDVKEIVEEAPVAKAINIILEYAVNSRASDIHIEPREGYVHIRFRIDGVLRDTMSLPTQILSSLVSRIKILSNLRIDEHRIPQDGRIKVDVGGKKIALRVSTLPIMDGEKVVMRILDEGTRAATIEELGFKGAAMDIIKKSLKKPHGMTLVTGPTGSGKSTTLYSLLSSLNTIGVNISTVEDPVEYRIQGINQTQVNPKVGMTFASGLRALLRQDPDVIMVGEIRDAETAEMAIHAALTGHIVLSTLHTNNASGTLPRLLDMGSEPFLIASTVNCVIAQRLVRKVCPHCKEAYAPTEEAITELKKDFGLTKMFLGSKPEKEKGKQPVSSTERKIMPSHEISLEKKSILTEIAEDPTILNRGIKETDKSHPKTSHSLDIVLYRGKGCSKCEQTGYLGRMGIFEVLEVNDEIGDMIIKRVSSEEMEKKSIENGMLTMQQDGFLKALEGFTTVEEVIRVTKD